MSESDQSGNLPEEPQAERGAPGSRDAGGPPGAGPADRPAGDPHSDDTTSVNDSGTTTNDTPADDGEGSDG